MFTNYLKIALRSLLRQKSFSAINIIGLAVGMACCFILALFVRQELRFDADIPNVNRMYRTIGTITRAHEGTSTTIPNSQFPLAAALKADFPEIEKIVRLNANGNVLLAFGSTKFLEKRIMYADNGYFQMFPSEFLSGNPQTALANPGSIVLTEDIAKKYFGNESALGKTLRLNNAEDVTVSAVIKNIPANRHLRFDALMPMQALVGRWQREGVNVDNMWFGFTNQYTYLQLKEGINVEHLRQQFPAFIERKMKSILERIGRGFVLDLQPLTEIHLHPLEGEIQPQGSILTLRIVGGIALVILILACINFMNLSTARSTRRAREVGMRKVFGAVRLQLIFQFLAESVVISCLALVLALALVEATLPFVNRLMDTQLSVGYFHNYLQVLSFVGFALLVGVCAGAYPALVLSGFIPVRVLKGSFLRTSAGSVLRKGLVVVQFTLSIALIAGTIVILQQLDFTQNKDLGFAKEQMMTINLPSDSVFVARKASMKSALRSIAGIKGVAAADYVPGDPENSQNPLAIEGAPEGKNVIVTRFLVDEDFVATMGLSVIEGRNFQSSMSTDAKEGFLLNEAAVKALGIGGDKTNANRIGTRLEWFGDRPTRKGSLIGIIKDFHYQSLHTPIAPAVFIINNEAAQRFVIRMSTNDIRGTMARIEEVWNQFAPNWVFEYSFVDQNFQALYNNEARIGRIVTVFAGLAIFIACLGLFGLAAFSAEVRTKEIGIRKVLGASALRIIALLSKDFLQLVGIAILIATPLAYWAAGRWLQDFAYRIELGVGVFILAGALAVTIAFLTVASQAWQAAQTNPINSLKSE